MKTPSFLMPCTLNEMLFPVELRDNPRNTNQEYSKVVVGHIDTGEIDLNYCSPRYQLVPNSEIFPKIEEIFKQNNVTFTVKYSMLKHAMFYAYYIIEDPAYAFIMPNTKDDIKFSFVFQHSYNGLWKYKGIAGFYRLVCKNGLTVPVKQMKDYNLQISGKHTPSILESLIQFDNLLKMIAKNGKEIVTSVKNVYSQLSDRMVYKVEDRIKEVLGAVGITAIDNKKFNTVTNIIDKIRVESDNPTLGYAGKISDWLIYNGINQYINDDELNIASPEKRKDKDIAVLEYLIANA